MTLTLTLYDMYDLLRLNASFKLLLLRFGFGVSGRFAALGISAAEQIELDIC